MKLFLFILLVISVPWLQAADTKEEGFDDPEIQKALNQDSNDTNTTNQHVDLTLIGRVMTNKDAFPNSPYGFALFESYYESDHYKVAGGMFVQRSQPNEEIPINHLYVEYFNSSFHFKIGKMVEKIGVLDYFSMLDTLNPPRLEFYDDPNMNIKRTPLWMAHADYYVDNAWKVSLYGIPFDAKNQDYKGYYVNYALNTFLPEAYSRFFNNGVLGQYIFAPTYYNVLSPYLAEDIASKSPSQSYLSLKNSAVGIVLEHNDGEVKTGFVYFNRYSEVPLIKVDANLVSAAQAYQNQGNPFPALGDYITSFDYNPIKSVEGFRYQQVGLYKETTIDSYGLRGEISYRDKVPLVNTFGSLTTGGFSIDHTYDTTYCALETQYIHLDAYDKSALISMFTTKFEPTTFWIFRMGFQNRLIGEAVDKQSDVAINPQISLSYKQTDFIIQGLASANNSQTNTLSFTLRSSF